MVVVVVCLANGAYLSLLTQQQLIEKKKKRKKEKKRPCAQAIICKQLMSRIDLAKFLTCNILVRLGEACHDFNLLSPKCE